VSSRPIFQDIYSDDLDPETIRIYEKAHEEFVLLERRVEVVLLGLLHRTVWSGMEEPVRKVLLDHSEIDAIRKYLNFIRFRNSSGYFRTIASLRDDEEEKSHEGSLYSAYRPLVIRIRKRFILRQFISFFKHTSADIDTHCLRPKTDDYGVDPTSNKLEDIMELYCWRLCGAEVCLGIAAEDQEYMLPDCVFGTLNEGFKEDPSVSLFYTS